MIENKENMDITVNYKGGGSFLKLPPQFSHDGQNIYVCSKNSILEYNTKTAKLIHEYKTKERIVGFSYHLYESFYCITSCCQNGKITTWKLITHSKISEGALPARNIKSFHIIPSEEEFFNAIYSYLRSDIVHFALWTSAKKKIKSTDYKLKLKGPDPYFLDIGNGFFSVAVKNEIYFIKMNDFQVFQKHLIGSNRNFTCLTCHPTEEVILVGDNSGRVVAWQDLFSKKPKQTVFHWHTLPVRTVSFSKSGSYFYSGGGESVLVKWLVENASDRRFVPRLPGEICHIQVSTNNLYIAVATNDNAVRILDNTLNQVSLIQHLVLANHFDSGIVHDLRSRSLIMNGNQGHIQFYCPDDMSLLYSVDIVGQNRITNERGVEMVNTEIKKVAISKTGLWFATVEERKDKEYSDEIRLKFWKFDESKQQFQLNTSVEYPHEDSINSMLFAPSQIDDNLNCITIGDDKKFKIWQITETEELSSTKLSWKCYCVGFYRNLPCNSLSFSIDGSLFATGFADILTVWTPDTCVLKSSLIHPIHKEMIRNIQFGNGNQCHLLVAASDGRVSVWNILTLSMIWTVPIKVSFLIADSLSSNMAVITQDKKVFVFSPNSSQPVYENNTLLKKFKSIKACNFVPSRNINDLRLSWYERTQLYFITSENELYCLCENELIPDVTGNEFIDDRSISIYEKSLPRVKTGSVGSVQAKNHLYEKDPAHKTFKTFLESPIHTLAPIRFSCYSLIKALVIQEEK